MLCKINPKNAQFNKIIKKAELVSVLAKELKAVSSMTEPGEPQC